MDSYNMESFEVANTLDLALSTPLPLTDEEEEEEKRGDNEGSPPSFGRIDPLPPCMEFFQVHLAHFFFTLTLTTSSSRCTLPTSAPTWLTWVAGLLLQSTPSLFLPTSPWQSCPTFSLHNRSPICSCRLKYIVDSQLLS